ncbi:MAG: glycogen/starch/alpha-glucan phosphorylase [Hyphomicrobiales bacterium]|nr:glycogen/starch/alpha-glucan phosphorylase [Hyphomicrobiales bacterium]
MPSYAEIKIEQVELQQEILRHLKHSLGKDPEHASTYDWRMSLSLALRDMIVEPWFESTRKTYEAKDKRVYYLSMEFLIGRLIEDVAMNLGVDEIAATAMEALGQDYRTVVADEPDAALGNGGLGRLAACFLDSLSTLSIPAYGYGIRYEHGLFEQHFDKGRQIETAESWLAQRHAWEFERPEVSYQIRFGGYVSETETKVTWHPRETVVASAYDTPIIGWKGKWANTLRLWAAKPTKVFDLESFNRGDYMAASAPEALARTISRVLYPDDTTEIGKELRLKQEYFFTSASILDLVRRFISEGHLIETLADYVAIQLNDTHPAIAGPELVRILSDEHGIAMEKAIDIARSCLSYTNHTLLPEALERWPEDLFARVLPRHHRIIEIIQAEHHAKTSGDIQIIEDGFVKMGELAFVMAHRVNGVSALHTELVKQTVFSELHNLHPERIVNQTNGVTPRRWLYSSNPPLRNLINDTIGSDWPDNLEKLEQLADYCDDQAFQTAFRAAKFKNKQRLVGYLNARNEITINPEAMFDVQIKRIHEYKRQLMNILEAVAFWNEIRDNPHDNWTPRVKIFGGKAAPGYVVAKEIIHLINDVAKTINKDPVTKDFLQIVYPENYNVSMAELLIPAADLSEQISTAGKEASGTGNMKFALNGALTIGTLDGANVEIREHVGVENFYLFGLDTQGVFDRRKEKEFARNAIAKSQRLSRLLGQIVGGTFSKDEPHRYKSLVGNLYEHDYFLVTVDFDSYFEKQREADSDYQDIVKWTKMAILNTAGMGWFSSDRTIQGYAKDIWETKSHGKPS